MSNLWACQQAEKPKKAESFLSFCWCWKLQLHAIHRNLPNNDSSSQFPRKSVNVSGVEAICYLCHGHCAMEVCQRMSLLQIYGIASDYSSSDDLVIYHVHTEWLILSSGAFMTTWRDSVAHGASQTPSPLQGESRGFNLKNGSISTVASASGVVIYSLVP